MVTTAALKLLFTKLERLLLRNQAKPFVIREKTTDTDTQEYSQIKRLDSSETNSRYFRKLQKGLLHDNVEQKHS